MKKKLSKEDKELLKEAEREFKYAYWKRKQTGRMGDVGVIETTTASGAKRGVWYSAKDK